jgi:lipopolysaccharide assembly outer membrane protein LptD (OstA)
VKGLITAALLAFAAPAFAQAPLKCKTPEHPIMLGTVQQDINRPVEGKPGVTKSTMTGDITIICDDTKIFANKIETFSDSPMVLASGDVNFEQPGLQIFADRAEINRETHRGTFFVVSGTSEAGGPGEHSEFGGVEPDMMFYGETLEKIGDRTYKLTNGAFTTCVQPTPRWQMNVSSMQFTLDKRAIILNAVLRVKDVPLLYVPAIYYPINKGGRSTGILMPQYGSSSDKGFTLGNAFFWAIDRSQDLTLYHTIFKKTGQDVGSEYRFVSTGGNGNALFHMLAEHDQKSSDGLTITRPSHRSYTLRGGINQALPRGFRFSGSANYFTDADTQQRYEQNVFNSTNRNRYIGGTLSGAHRRYRFDTTVEQTDTYYGLSSATRSGRAPVAQFNLAAAPIGRSRVYFGAKTEAGYFLRQEDLNNPATNHSLFRIDGAPTIQLPIGKLPFLSMSTTASWRFTYWTKSRDPFTTEQIDEPITRQIFDLTASVVGPTFSRIYSTPDSGYAERYKHVIEPRFDYRYTSPFTRVNEVWQLGLDGTDSVYGGTSSLTYGVTSRLLAKRRMGAHPSVVRDILDVSANQTYYSNACAAGFDPRYSSSFSTGYCLNTGGNPFSALQLSAQTRPTEHLTAQFRTEIDSKFRTYRTMTASGGYTGELVQVNAGWSKNHIIPGLPGFDLPVYAYQALNASTTVRTRSNQLGGTFAFSYDVQHGNFVQYRVISYYSSQCCGVNFEYDVVTNRAIPIHRFGVSFTLSGLGSFSNPMGSFGGR